MLWQAPLRVERSIGFRRKGVLVDDGESGRGDDVGDAENLADGLDESGLAGTHLSVEGEDAAGAYAVDELACGVRQAVGGGDGDGHRFFPVSVTMGMIISSIEMPPCWKVSR